MKLHFYRFEDPGGVLVLEELLLLAQDGRLENVVDVLVPGPGEHGQHHLVAMPVLVSAVKGSIGSTIGFHNHGEGPY